MSWQTLVNLSHRWQGHVGAHSHSSCCRGAGSMGISVMGHSPSHRCFSFTSRSASGGACAHADCFLPREGMGRHVQCGVRLLAPSSSCASASPPCKIPAL